MMNRPPAVLPLDLLVILGAVAALAWIVVIVVILAVLR